MNESFKIYFKLHMFLGYIGLGKPCDYFFGLRTVGPKIRSRCNQRPTECMLCMQRCQPLPNTLASILN